VIDREDQQKKMKEEHLKRLAAIKFKEDKEKFDKAAE
jgi:F0F1-type ATP synthase assembly protein I